MHNVYYILQCFRLHVRRDLVHNIHHIAIYLSYYDYVLSLKMVLAETCCWWLLINKAVFRLHLHLFYSLVRFWFVTVFHGYLNLSRPDYSHSKIQISCPFATSQFVLNNPRSCVPFREMWIFKVKNCLPLAAGPRNTASWHGTWILNRVRTKSIVGHWYEQCWNVALVTAKCSQWTFY